MKTKILLYVIFASFAVNANAEVILNFSPSHLSSVQWAKTTFRGELNNAGTERVYINGINFSEPNATLSIDSNIFFESGPAYLDPNEGWTGDFFDIYNDITASLGDHVGTLTILGGIDPNAVDALAVQNFQLTILPIMDYSQNQKIDLPDLAFFVESWLTSPCDESNSWCDDRDINHLGSVGFDDFQFFAQIWLINLDWQGSTGDWVYPSGVNMEDLDYFVQRWLMNNCTSVNGYCGGADLNFSGIVDLADLSILAANWMRE